MNPIIIVAFLFINVSSYAQDHIKPMLSFFKEHKYIQAFNYGGNKVLQLRANQKRNYYLEFLTWASLAQSTNIKDKSCGCKSLADYWEFKRKYFDYNSEMILSKIYDSICKLNTHPSFPNAVDYSQSTFKRNSQKRYFSYIDGEFKRFYDLMQLKHYEFYDRHWNYRNDLFPFESLRVNIETTDEYISEEPDSISIFSLPDIKQINLRLKKIYKNINYFETSNFILISKSKSVSNLKIVSIEIQKVLNYYSKFLGLKSGSRKIVIFLSDSFQDVSDDIYNLYGVYGASSTLGYTDLNTKSICAWIPTNKGIGTIKHELIHLICSEYFLAVPDWFEEGLACLYEESKFLSNNNLTPRNNWRLNFLQELQDDQIGSLFESLITNSDDTYFLKEASIYRRMEKFIENGYEKIDTILFDFEEATDHLSAKERDSILKRVKNSEKFEDIVRSIKFFNIAKDDFIESCYDAMSRYIFIYLNDKGKLLDVIKATKMQYYNALSGQFNTSFTEMILLILKSSSIEEAKKDFIRWYTKRFD